MSALPINSVDVNFAGIFAEVEQLKAMGGDEMVKTKLFPRFEEAGIILYPGMFSEERGLVKVKPCSIPHSQSPQPASKLQQCSPPPADGECVGELVHQLQQNSESRFRYYNLANRHKYSNMNPTVYCTSRLYSE